MDMVKFLPCLVDSDMTVFSKEGPGEGLLFHTILIP